MIWLFRDHQLNILQQMMWVFVFLVYADLIFHSSNKREDVLLKLLDVFPLLRAIFDDTFGCVVYQKRLLLKI